MEPVIPSGNENISDPDFQKPDSGCTDPKKKCGALYAASMWRSPTSKVDPRNRHRGFSSTGTNISYEGHTDPGVGPGSAEA
ncbi:hypothetical protein ACTHGU_20455 [Chitinophagaceae bacterium MMS25-I14]